MSRSELYAVALAEYVAKHRDEEVTSKLNEVLAEESSSVDPALRTAQAKSISPGTPRLMGRVDAGLRRVLAL